jgi:hypothetical protein
MGIARQSHAPKQASVCTCFSSLLHLPVESFPVLYFESWVPLAVFDVQSLRSKLTSPPQRLSRQDQAYRQAALEMRWTKRTSRWTGIKLEPFDAFYINICQIWTHAKCIEAKSDEIIL